MRPSWELAAAPFCFFILVCICSAVINVPYWLITYYLFPDFWTKYVLYESSLAIVLRTIVGSGLLYGFVCFIGALVLRRKHRKESAG